MSYSQPIPDFIQRRIAFVLDEAAQREPIRDLAVTWTLRAIWNFLAIGNPNASSNQLKRKGRFRSRAAHELSKELPLKEWLKAVTYEHEMPIEHMWQWMRRDRRSISAAASQLTLWLPVIVTNEENKRLPPVGLTYDDRYGNAGIEVLYRTDENEWVLRPLRVSAPQPPDCKPD